MIPVSVRVTNAGKLDGEEVVELYVSSQGNSSPAPIRALKGFKRINLKAGESKVVSFDLSKEDVSSIDDNGHAKPLAGKISISVGGCQPDETTRAKKKTVEGSFMLKM